MTSMKKINGQLFIRPIRLSEGKPPEEIQVLPVGEWDHPAYGKFKIDERDLEEFVENFSAGVRNDIPITEGHAMPGEEKPAVGWFTKLINRGSDGLWAAVEWTEQGKELLRQKAYKYFSPEFYEKYEDPETREIFRNVLVGGALTNSPYFKELAAVILSENIIINPSNDDMFKLEDIVQKAASELVQEEQDFLREHKDELSAEDRKKFAEVLGDDTSADNGGTGAGGDSTGDGAPGGEGDSTGGDGNGGQPHQAREPHQPGMVTMSEAELKALQDKANKGADAERQVREMKFSSEVQGWIFNDQTKKGRLATKSKDKVVSFMMTLNENQLVKFREIMGELPEVMTFEEIGDGHTPEEPDAVREFNEKVTEKMADGKLKYSEALDAVARENPDLANRYNEAMQPA
jgi:hypothetical protein